MNLWTDGACFKSGVGGWAFILERDGKILSQRSGGHAGTTNNRMELKAAIEGLRAAAEFDSSRITIWSDSKYVLQGIASWIRRWKKNGWKTGYGAEVKNRGLWEQLDREVGAVPEVKFRWVPGHGGYVYNEHVDILARQEAERIADASAT